MRHAAGAGPDVSAGAADAPLLPAAPAPTWGAPVGFEPVAAQQVSFDVVLADGVPAGTPPVDRGRAEARSGRTPGAHARTGPAAAEPPVEPVSQHAWMGPEGLVIPMPGRDALRPSGTL